MRCQKCGKQLDSRARFCTNCDHDNYPEMNRVVTKGNAVHSQSTTVRATSSVSNNSQTASTVKKNQQQKKPKVGLIIFIIVIIYILMNVLGE